MMVLQNDSREAISELFRLYSNDVFRYASLTLGSSAEGKDVVQEVFFRAFCSWENFRQDSHAKTWLFSIARNYIFDLLRKKRRESKLMDEYTPPSVKDEILSAETMMVLQESLYKLKETHREVFVLRHVEMFSIRETANLLRYSEAKVRTTDYRAIRRLRELMNSNALEVSFHDE